MTANVKCDGRYVEIRDRETPTETDITQPCGWEGERLGRPTKINGEIHWDILTIPNDPCPQCGGRIQFVEPQPSP